MRRRDRVSGSGVASKDGCSPLLRRCPYQLAFTPRDITVSVARMPVDDVTLRLAKALASLVRFVEERPSDATEDDDVRALEEVALVLNGAASQDRARLRALLGTEVSEWLGLT